MYRIIARIVAQKKILLLLFFAAAVCFLAQRPEQSKAAGSADSVSGPKVIVLNYHKVDNMNISLSVPPSEFERQIAFLAQNGYHTITPHELYMAFTDGAELRAMGLIPVFAPVAGWKNGLVRHDPAALAAALMALYYEYAVTRTAT